MGPNATIGHGSLIYSLDWTAEWMVQWLRKMAREDIASIAPKQDVVDELVRYGDEIMKTLTWTGNCRFTLPSFTLFPHLSFQFSCRLVILDLHALTNLKAVRGTRTTVSTAA